MRFTPKSEEELQAATLVEEGIYSYQVIDAKESLSKAGSPMIEMKLLFWDKVGKEHVIFDYLLEAMGHKLRHFCDSHNMLDKYNSGELTSKDCWDKQGKIDLVIQEGKAKPSGGLYPNRNTVKDYVVSAEPLAQPAPLQDKNGFDSDLPF